MRGLPPGPPPVRAYRDFETAGKIGGAGQFLENIWDTDDQAMRKNRRRRKPRLLICTQLANGARSETRHRRVMSTDAAKRIYASTALISMI